MENEHQSTLKKKIQILFQLGKWPDVVKLCESYGESYGKDMEIDLIRFKCQRHMGIPAAESKPETEAGKSAAAEKAPPRESARAAGDDVDPTIPLIPPTISDELASSGGEKAAYDYSPEPDEVDIGDPFADNELAISDPFADSEPGLRLAPEGPPVHISESEPAAAEPMVGPSSLEMESPDAADSQPADGDSEPDFANMGSLTIDAEPELLPAAALPERAAPAMEEVAPTKPDDPSRMTSGRVEVLAERVEEKRAPSAPFVEEEAPRPRASMFTPAPEKEAPPRRKPFTIKLALLIVLPLLFAIALWLALSGKLNLGGDEPPPAPEPAVERPLPRRVRPPKTVVTPDAAAQAAAQQAEQEKTFSEKLKQAEALNQQGDLLNAWAALLEAKKIKVTEPLQKLEEQLALKMSEARAAAKKVTETVKSEYDREIEALAKAREANTIAGWQDFLRAYPQSESASQAQARIGALEKKAQEEAQQLLLQRIRQAQKVRMRSTPLNLSQAELSALPGLSARPPTQFEAHPHGGVTVVLDLSAGLMWSLYDKPMAYDKARWWANRVTAGYSGWRLPTVEEALALLQMDKGRYAGLADFSVWTCDGVSNQPRSAWVLRLPAGQFVVAPYSQMSYVWAVRSAVK
ncbi:MAG: DUF1566 domain-containing protein [Acidobacteria bacterium]|jgi:hypothetical protein|nr:DUF1566 domain-containing protein [Acidobacteriota bacterium]